MSCDFIVYKYTSSGCSCQVYKYTLTLACYICPSTFVNFTVNITQQNHNLKLTLDELVALVPRRSDFDWLSAVSA
jgi:hypothetical protein